MASTKKASWKGKYTSSSRPGSSSGSVPTVTEGVPLETASPVPLSASPNPFPTMTTGGTSPVVTPPVSRPTTPRRWSTANLLSPPQNLDNEGTQLIINALERTSSAQPSSSVKGSSFGRMSFSSMMGGLSSLSLSRTNTNSSITDDAKDKEKERGRSLSKIISGGGRSSSHALPPSETPSRSQSRARSTSPFSFRRFRTREPSPTPQPIPLAQSDVDLSDSPASSIRPRNAFTSDAEDSGDETAGDDADSDDEEWSDDDLFDPVTERNTERNAFIEPALVHALEEIEPDPLGEGVNVVVPPEPYFPSTLNSYSRTTGTGTTKGKRNPRRRKSTKHHEPLPLATSRPIFQRDRCTISIVQGDPEAALGDRRRKRYVVASDLSEESRYAVEWAIGTVLRDGDEMLVVTVVETESKIDPAIPSAADRATKLRSQQERQGLSYILVRQVTGLLQRTKLNVTVSCQAWHAKNARHMLLDIVDYNEPIMLIVGSRGIGQLKGILLGSTSHYLIQKCSVPVMVARRRLKRPPKKSAHLAKNRAHVKLAEAGIDRVAAKVDQDVRVMRDEIQRDDARRDGGSEEVGQECEEEPDADAEDEDDVDDSPAGVKIPG